MSAGFVRLAFVLGLLSAVGPFAIDMYLPAMPAIGVALDSGSAGVQASLAAFFLAFALSHVVFGPASDRYGRKPPLYVGLVLFVIGSVGSALAPDIGWLIAFRALQGFGGGAPIVVPRAIVRDLYTGIEATRLMALLMLVFSVSPVLAPLAGSLIIDVGSWRTIFWVVAGIGAVALLGVRLELAETRPQQTPVRGGGRDGAGGAQGSVVAEAARAFGRLLRDRHFLGLVGVGAFGMAGVFIYIGSSSFVLMQHYGLSAREYGLAFGANAVSFFLASQFAARGAARYGLPRLIRGASAAFAGVMVVTALLFWAGIDSLPALIGLLMLGYAGLGLVIPTSTVLALEPHGEQAGAASALMGMLQLLLGAVLIAAFGPFADQGPRPMLAGIAASAVITWLLALRSLPPEPVVAPAA